MRHENGPAQTLMSSGKMRQRDLLSQSRVSGLGGSWLVCHYSSSPGQSYPLSLSSSLLPLSPSPSLSFHFCHSPLLPFTLLVSPSPPLSFSMHISPSLSLHLSFHLSLSLSSSLSTSLSSSLYQTVSPLLPVRRRY